MSSLQGLGAPLEAALLPALSKMEGPLGAFTSLLVVLTLHHQLGRKQARQTFA